MVVVLRPYELVRITVQANRLVAQRLFGACAIRITLEWGVMMPTSPGPLLNSLPAIYHTSEDLRQLLAVFEAVLFGVDGQRGRHETAVLGEILPLVHSIATIASLFDAYKTPKELVPWLAQWVALTHLSGLSEPRQRDLLARIVPLYAQRGTKNISGKLLEFFKPENTRVTIDDQELRVLL